MDIFCAGFSRAVLNRTQKTRCGETGVVPFGDVPNGWKPFMAMVGSSSIRKLDFRKECAAT